MKKEEIKLQEQEAPQKNTDGAFVQVGKDGSPVIPDEKASKEDLQKPKPGSLKDR